MKLPSVYLKMRVLGAVDTVLGRTRHERIHNVAAMIFLDEEGNPRQFTWRTIQTWHYRYKNHGITGMTNQPRKDNRQFTDWVEHDYNATEHDAIGMKPIDRFGIDLACVRFLAPSEHSDELFYAEAQRKVKKDNTFSFQGRRYETPVDLRDREIQIRHDRRRHDATAVIVYCKGQRMGAARLLDAVANGLLRRREQP
jgi:hypothetical protein